MPTGMQVVRFIAGGLALCGLMVFTFAFLEWRDRTQFLREAIETTGEVVEAREFRTAGRKFSSTAYAFVVRFASNKGTIERDALDTSSSPRLSPGEKVRVWYSSTSPEHFRVDHFALMWGGVVVGLAIAFGLLGAGATAFWIAGGKSPRGVKMEAKLPEMARAWREGRLTRNSEYQALLIAFAFVGFPLLALAVSFLLLAPLVLQLIVGGALAWIAFRAIRARRRR